MKVLFIENDFQNLKHTVDLFNIVNLNNNLTYDVVTKSQDIDYNNINDYDFIIVDIHLTKSYEDGFQIIEKMLNNHNVNNEKIIILSGMSDVNEQISERKLNVNIIKKPLRINDLKTYLLP